MAELKEKGLSWGEAQASAKDRTLWQNIIVTSCPTGDKEDKRSDRCYTFIQTTVITPNWLKKLFNCMHSLITDIIVLNTTAKSSSIKIKPKMEM
jgi:hypothetical protein